MRDPNLLIDYTANGPPGKCQSFCPHLRYAPTLRSWQDGADRYASAGLLRRETTRAARIPIS